MNYIVKKEDSLDWILEKFDLDYETFRKANPQMTPVFLKENEMIYIPNKNEGNLLN